MRSLNRLDQIPALGPELWVLRLKANQELACTVLSEAPWLVMTHWTGNSTEGCLVPKKECPGCKRGQPKRAKGYLHVYDHHKQQEVFLELTPTATKSLMAQIGNGEPLRGQRMTIRRMSGDKARLRITLLAHHSVVSRAELPKCRDPHNTLCKLWGLDDLIVRADVPTVVPFKGEVG